MASLTISPRFRGPAGSGNGGYVSGRLAAYVGADDEPVTVVLRQPPPLQTRLQIVPDRAGVRLVAGDRAIAEASPGAFAHPPVAAVTLDTARAAEPAYRGLVDHPFPMCFVCGPARAAADGLRLSPGRCGHGRTACVWRPHTSLGHDADGCVSAEFVWSALDCPGAWTSDLDERPLVLGTMTAVCEERVAFGRDYVVVGQLLAAKGRKTFTATAIFDEAGTRLARAEQVWIAVDPAVFQQPADPGTTA